MPGYVIHLATANEYIRKHKNEIKNKEDFFKGCIAPDETDKENKKITHYGNGSDQVELRKYLQSNNLESDYQKGYFLHLITDYIFYNKLLECISKKIYNDYDILNDYLIKKYDVKLLDEIKDKVFYTDGQTEILSRELAEKIIDVASETSLEEIKNEIISCDYIEKWDKIRLLKRI
ncbi:MAG: hypothetical protein IKN09_02500 [Clostridia bacterium]|nr:hypothetical protein [Clostridia bacterium]